jgi:DNA-directed RNA polymerase I subunit RPA49
MPYKRNKIVPNSESTELLLQSSDHSRLDYIAQEEHDGSSESQLQDFIGVYDPATSALQLVPVKRIVVRSTLRSEAEDMRAQEADAEAQPSNMTAKRAALALEFGSKKSRKAHEDRTLNAITSGADAETVAENVLDKMASTTGAMPTKEELAAAVDSSKPRPTPNLAAEYPGDVYPTDVVVGSELMTMLEVKDWVQASVAGEGVSVTSKYVAKRIVKLAKNKQIQKLKVLRFVLLCINFNASLIGGAGPRPKKIPMKGKLEAAMGEDTPVGQVMAIRRKFALEGSGDMPRWNIDNLMTHVAAAALIVDDFEVDVNDLREDLKLENKEYVSRPWQFAVPLTNSLQSQAVLRGAGMQAHSAHTNRSHQVEAHKGREREPLRRKTQAAIDVPQGRRSAGTEEALAGPVIDDHGSPQLEFWSTASAFILHYAVPGLPQYLMIHTCV